MPTNVATIPSTTGGIILDINSQYEKVAMVFVAPSTNYIDGVFFKLSQVTTGCTLNVRIEQVDTATGEPNGVLISSTAGRESATTVTVSAAGNFYAQFPQDEELGSFELTQGTLCAVLFRVASGTPSGIHFATFQDDNAACGMPYCLDYDGTTSTQSVTFVDNRAPVMGILVGQGTYQIKHFWPFTSVQVETFGATSTPDTIGNRLQITAPSRICGARVWVDSDSTGTIKLYDKNGSTVLASANIYASVPPVETAHVAEYFFSQSVDLAVGNYYLAVEATSATIGIATMTFPTSPVNYAWRSSPLGAGTLAYATCTQTPTSTSSWTITTSKQAFITPIFSGSELGGGAGGGETSHVFAA